MENLKKIIGKRVREIRKQLELTQEDLADKAGLDYRSIGAIERGERNLSMESLFSIAKALGVTSNVLITDDAKKSLTKKELLIQEINFKLRKKNYKEIKYFVEIIKLYDSLLRK